MIYESLFAGMIGAAKTKGWKLEPESSALALLTYMPVTVTGEESGVRVQLARFSSVHTFSITAFIEPAIATPFVITNEGLTGAIAHTLGIEDVEIGDAEFDKAFRLVSKDAAALRRIVTPEVQTVLKELAAATDGFGSHFRVTDQVVWIQHSSLGLMTEEECLRDVPLVVRVVQTLATAAKT